MPATGTKRVGVIGAGMVGVCAASWLQRDGHSVFLVEAGEPGHGASFGNAGCLNGSSVTPVSMPGVIRNVPRWLLDPLGPLSLRWTYLPAIAPWLVRFVRSGTPDKVRAQARALRPLVGPTLEALKPLVAAARVEDLVHRLGHLYVYRSAESLEKDRLAWQLRRENGVEIDEFDADELRQLEPALSRDYVRGVLVRENGHTSNPLGLVERLLGHFVRSGGELVRARANGFRLDGRRLAAIQTDSGDLPADAAVVCAGAYSKPLAAALGDRVPLETERGYQIPSACRVSRLPMPTANLSRLRWTPGCALPAPSNWPGSQHLLIGGVPASFLRKAARCYLASPPLIRRSGSRCGWAIARAFPTRYRCSVRHGPRRTCSTPSATAMSG